MLNKKLITFREASFGVASSYMCDGRQISYDRAREIFQKVGSAEYSQTAFGMLARDALAQPSEPYIPVVVP